MGTLTLTGVILLIAVAAALAIALFVLLTRVVEFVVLGALLIVAIGSGDGLFILVTLGAFLVAVALRINAMRTRPRRLRR